MTIATIDIGTNAVLLLVAQTDSQGTVSRRAEEQRIPRLGMGLDERRVLQGEAMSRVIAVLREYRRIIDRFRAESTVVCGTSAVRDAANRDDFVELVKKESGFTLELLSGDEEALWTYRGALSGIMGTSRATVVDIGGGSTEISVGDSKHVTQRTSLDIGSVRLTERIFRHDPPTFGELEAAIEETEEAIQEAARFAFDGSDLIGVAGTATSLAILAQGLSRFDIDVVSGYRLRKQRVEELFQMLRELPSDQIRRLSSVMEGRNDIIVAGTLILREIMAHFGFEEMIVSERGVRYGLAIREWEKKARGIKPKR